MPIVGKKKFGYGRKGKEDAVRHAKKTGQKVKSKKKKTKTKTKKRYA